MEEVGPAEIALGGPDGPIKKLHHHRSVEAIVLGDDRNIGGRGVWSCDRRGQIAGQVCQHKADDQDGEAHQRRQTQPAKDKRQHAQQLGQPMDNGKFEAAAANVRRERGRIRSDDGGRWETPSLDRLAEGRRGEAPSPRVQTAAGCAAAARAAGKLKPHPAGAALPRQPLCRNVGSVPATNSSSVTRRKGRITAGHIAIRKTPATSSACEAPI